MRLRFILGSTGSGKTTLCINEIIEKAADGTHALYIVPEQFSLESERLLTAASKNGIIMQSEVLSFAHLAHRMLLKTGGYNEKILDDNAKVLLLRRIIGELIKKNKLKFYGKSAARQGFIDNISAMLTELTRCCVSADTLCERADNVADTNKALSDKLYDIALIYKSFNQSLIDRYIAKDSLLDILAERITETDVFKNTEIWIDSFTDFTPQEFKVINALMRVSLGVSIALTIPDKSVFEQDPYNWTISDFDPYREAKRSIRHITMLANKGKIKIEPAVFLREDKRHANSPELKHLTANYFNGKAFTGKCENIKLFSAASIEAELNATAGEILSLLRQGYKYSDIAVMVSTDSYHAPLKAIFERYNIPYFTDVKRTILFHPLIELVRCFFKLLSTGFGTREVFRLLHTGFNDFTAKEISFAENYCIACGIRGKRWYEEWSYIPAPIYKEAMNDLNDIRSNICDMLDKISVLKQKSSIRSISVKIYELFDYFEVKEKLSEWIDKAKASGDEDVARLHTQVWDLLGSIFSKLCEIMGEDELSTAEFAKLLDAPLQSASLAIIPPTCESVTIAEFNRSRLPNIKALFMLGVNEGLMPPHRHDVNLLTDTERDTLLQNGCELGGDSLRMINRDRYNIFASLSKPSDLLYIYSNTSLESGIAARLVEDIRSDFGITAKETATEATDTSDIFAREQAFELFLKKLASNTDTEALSKLYPAIYASLTTDEKYAARLKRVEDWLNLTDPSLEALDVELARQLFLNNQTNNLAAGITSIEKYAKCPYMYFMDIGLNAKERKEYEPGAPGYGTLLHNVLKEFSEAVQKEASWTELTEDYVSKKMSAIVDKNVTDYASGFFEASATNRYIGERLKAVAINTAKTFTQHIDGFIPYGYEVSFGPDTRSKLPPLTYELENGVKLVLNGSIDRVDLYTDENKNTYVKITDYKSQGRDGTIFSTEKLFLGIQLQLPLYMQAYTNSISNTQAGGFFYFKVNNNLLKNAKQTAFDALTGGGAVVNNPTIVNALNENEKNNLNAFLMLPEGKLESLTGYVNKIITDMGKQIINGKVAAKPYSYNKESPCTYCEYSAVCCFELCTGKNEKSRTLTPEAIEELNKEIIGQSTAEKKE
jgi:ATP-dependent helicase/nuclease subunit B